MILGKLQIQSFRGMTDVALDRLAPISLAIGANNVGKSSLLEAAALLLRPFDPGQWVQRYGIEKLIQLRETGLDIR